MDGMNAGSNITEDIVRELIGKCVKSWHSSASDFHFVSAGV